MAERHGAHPELVINPEDRQIVRDLMASFDGQNRRNLTRLRDALDIGRVECELNLIGMCVEDALHCVPKIKRAADGFRPLVVRRYPKREEWSVGAAFAQPRQVGVTTIRALAD